MTGRRTTLALLAVHFVFFLFVCSGQIAPGNATNVVVAIGMAVEIPGWFLSAHLFFKGAGTGITLAATFVINALIYGGAGLAMDSMKERSQ